MKSKRTSHGVGLSADRGGSPGRETWRKLDREHRYLDLSDYARPVALALVVLLKDTPVRSLHVTALFLGVGVVAGILIGRGEPWAWFWAAVLLQIKNLLDAVDGSLARAQARPSRVGRFLDSVSDFVVGAVVHGGMALALEPALGRGPAWALSACGFLSTLIQGSYYSFFSVAIQTRCRGRIMSRVDESEPHPDGETESWLLRSLRRLYLWIYGWQDRLIRGWVRWAMSRDAPRQNYVAPGISFHPRVFSPNHLTRVSLLGLGTQLLLASLCLWAAAATRSPSPLVLYLLLGLVLANLLLALDLIWIRVAVGQEPPAREPEMG